MKKNREKTKLEDKREKLKIKITLSGLTQEDIIFLKMRAEELKGDNKK